MKTIVHVELTDDERRRLAQHIYGRAAPLSRKEVTALVEGLFDYLKEVQHEQHIQPAQPSVGQHAPAAVFDEVSEFKSRGAQPKRPNDPSYMRGWNAVGEAVTRARRPR